MSQPIQFSISTQFCSIRPIDKTLSGATTPSQSGPDSDRNKRVLRILHRSGVTGASPSDCLASYPGHLLEESYPSEEMQSVYSAAPAKWPTYPNILLGVRYVATRLRDPAIFFLL